MEEIRRKPAVMEPSQAPKRARTTKSPAKFLHAAWHIRAIDHTKMLMLGNRVCLERLLDQLGGDHKPHPLADREPLEGQVLGIHENKIGKIEYGPQPEYPGARLVLVWQRASTMETDPPIVPKENVSEDGGIVSDSLLTRRS